MLPIHQYAYVQLVPLYAQKAQLFYHQQHFTRLYQYSQQEVMAYLLHQWFLTFSAPWTPKS